MLWLIEEFFGGGYEPHIKRFNEEQIRAITSDRQIAHGFKLPPLYKQSLDGSVRYTAMGYSDVLCTRYLPNGDVVQKTIPVFCGDMVLDNFCAVVNQYNSDPNDDDMRDHMVRLYPFMDRVARVNTVTRAFLDIVKGDIFKLLSVLVY